MQTENKKDPQKGNWTWREIFDQYFWTELKSRVSGFLGRSIRIGIIFGILLYFFTFGIVPSDSMIPTLNVNDLVLYKKSTTIQRGDIISFDYPFDENLIYVKRVIGFPGDTIAVHDQKVYINGKNLEEDYTAERPFYTYEEKVVPEGHYFVLGDNRNNSDDSSVWGFLPVEKVRGEAVAILWPPQHVRLFSNQAP